MAYYLETDDRELLDKLRQTNVCAECGGELEARYDIGKHLPYLQCKYNPQLHEGIEREPSRYEKGGLSEFSIIKRREIVAEKHGEAKTTALAKYINVGTITRAIATEIVETLWGAAPPLEKTKAIIICQSYQLNPLMKHLHLVGYRRKDKATKKFIVDKDGNYVLDWSIMIGIGATRLMAQRKHNYTYLDMSPRQASAEEIRKILGDTADSNYIYGFCWIRDLDTGAEAFGLRGIRRGEIIQGTEKGNTLLNMACVRAERQCLDRQYPGETPEGVEVVDERYIDVDYKVIDGKTGEITEEAPPPAPAAEEEEPEKRHCDEHDCDLELMHGRYGPFYAHKLADGKLCTEKKKKATKSKATPPAPAPAAEAEQAPPEDLGIDLDWLKESLVAIHWDNQTALSWIKSQFTDVDTTGGLVEDVLPRLTTEQKATFVNKIEELREVA